MPVGFFSQPAVTTGRRPIPLLPRCGSCGLYRHCDSPKMPVYGKGKREILIVGECPGKNEDLQGRPFIGKSGQLLSEKLAKFDIDMDRDCWITNSLICRPHHPDDSNRTPSPKEIEACQPNLVNAVKKLKPKLIIPLGGPAIKSLLGWLWKKDTGNMSRWDGWQIPCQQINAWICPTFHPSYILRSDYGAGERFKANALGNDVRVTLFERHLQAASEKDARPWQTVPDWSKQIEVVMEDERAARMLADFRQQTKGPFAFDYETDRLKPDHKDARIVSCSVSNGKTTFAFPWQGKARYEMGELIRSNLPKIASNMAFEERWTVKEFGHGVNNWWIDTALAAHVLDNRPMISSIKFQAFVQLGLPPWDERVSPYLKAKGTNEPNRIKECPLPDLLKYNAWDSLAEYKVAKKQDKQIDAKGVRQGYDLFHNGTLTLARMTANGLMVDEVYLEKAIKRIDRKVYALQAELDTDETAKVWRKEYGKDANFGSSQQLEHIVFDVLGHKARGKTTKGRRSTSKSALENVDLPFLRTREKIESLKKARSTNLVGLRREVVNGIVHPFFSLTSGDQEEDKGGAESYRSSSSGPNLQNQVRRNEEIAKIVRRCYVARPGHRIVAVDFSAHEFKIAASFWDDPAMIEYASDPTKDVHRDLAAELFICSKSEVSKVMRDITKNQLTFPILFGSYYKKIAQGVWGLLDKMNARMADGGPAWYADIPVKTYLAADDRRGKPSAAINELGACDPKIDAVPGTFEYHVKGVEEKFMRRFPVFARLRNEWYDEYRKKAGFPLLTGFFCDGLYSKNETMNFPIQGAAFHVLLWSATEIEKRIIERNMQTLLIAEIHDDLMADSPEDEVQDYLNLAEKVMTRSVRKAMTWIKTPLEIEASCSEVGGTWHGKVKWVKNAAGVWGPKG